MRCATLFDSLFVKRKTQARKPKLSFLKSLINAAISYLSSFFSCSLRITDRESPSISTSLNPRCKPGCSAWRHATASAEKTDAASKLILRFIPTGATHLTEQSRSSGHSRNKCSLVSTSHWHQRQVAEPINLR